MHCVLTVPASPPVSGEGLAGDAAAPPPRVAVTAVCSRSSHLTHSASSPGSCAVMTELRRRGMTKKTRSTVRPGLRLYSKRNSRAHQLLNRLCLNKRPVGVSCLSGPLSALAGTQTESSSEVINLFLALFASLGAN